MTRARSATVAALAALAFMVTACSSTVTVPRGGDSAGEGGAQASFTNFPDIPVPVKADIDVDRTLVLGGGDAWIGRLVIGTSYGTYEMFDFFKRKFPEYGWTEVATVRAKTSVLTFSRQNRVATVQITSTTLRGSESVITVTPRDMSGPSAVPAAR